MDELNKIIDRYTEGNYLIGKTAKEEMAKEILHLFNVVGRSEQLKAFLLFIQENAPNYRTKQIKPDQAIKAYLESI